MTVATYTTTLVDVSTAENTTGWTKLGAGASGLSADPDFAIQGTNSVTKQVSNAKKGMYHNASYSLWTSEILYVWIYATTPGLMDTKANGGMSIYLATDARNYREYYIRGKDEYELGGWICVPIAGDYTNYPPTTVTGTNSTTITQTGAYLKTTATVKAVNFSIDAMRHGSAVVQVLGGTGADPLATLDALATKSELRANRWGIIQTVPGGFTLQGILALGDATNPCELDASDISITFLDNEFIRSINNQITLRHIDTVVNFTSVNFLSAATGTNPRGYLNLTDTPTLNCTSCRFVGIELVSFEAGSTIEDCLFDGLDWVSNNQGGTINNCTIRNGTEQIQDAHTADLDTFTNSVFESSGSGHAIRLTALGTGTMTWTNIDSGYATVDGSTGDETLWVDVASGTLTVNVAGGATTPTVRTTGATITVQNAPVVSSVNVKSLTLGTNIQNANVYLVADTGGDLSAGTEIIKGLTDASGNITDTRSYSANQPVEGWVRKATGSPLYQQTAISGTINKDNGFDLNVQLLDDE